MADFNWQSQYTYQQFMGPTGAPVAAQPTTTSGYYGPNWFPAFSSEGSVSQIKKVIILVDAIANGLWAFMWFVCFVFTADQLRKTNIPGGSVANCARSGVAFSFFSILIWIAIVVVNVFLFVRIIKGNDRDCKGGTSGSGYASFPEPSADQPYQGEGGEAAGGGQQYSPPEY